MMLNIKIITYRKKLLAIAFMAIFSLFLAYISWKWVGLNLCSSDTPTNSMCTDIFIHTLSGPFLKGFFLPSIVITSLILIYPSVKVFNVWKWFALLYIPIATVLIITSESTLLFSKTTASDILGWAFLILSMILAMAVIIRNYLKENKGILVSSDGADLDDE